MDFSANISLMYGHIAFDDRPAAARDDGFGAVECWWPFASSTPTPAEVDGFVGRLERAGMPLTALNLFAGDMAAGERGILSDPAADDVFARHLPALEEVARRTGCRVFNALYGQRRDGLPAAAQDAVARDRLRRADDVLAPLGGTIVIEPLTRGENGAYPLTTLGEALEVAASTGRQGVKALFDAFHLHNNGADLASEMRAHAARVGHVQIADSPGRGRPGTGTIDFAALYDAIEVSGYSGRIGCEYRETEMRGVPTRNSLERA